MPDAHNHTILFRCVTYAKPEEPDKVAQERETLQDGGRDDEVNHIPAMMQQPTYFQT